MADATIDLPAVGGVPKRVVLVGGALIAVIVGVAWWRHSQAAAAPAAVTTADPLLTQPDTTAPGAGYVNPAPGSNNTAGSSPVTNIQWENSARDALEALGYDPQTVASALALYLDSKQLTTDQANLVRQAWAEVGRPPETPSLPIITAPTGTTPPAAGTPPAVPKNFRWAKGQVTRQSIGVQWDPVAGATDYLVHYGPRNLKYSTTILAPATGLTVGGLAPGTVYWMNVQAHNAAGFSGGSNMETNLKTTA